MSNYDERFQAITEKTSAAMSAFWSALLTAHTVLLSVAVALPSFAPAASFWQFKVVALLATACMFALLFNFAAVRMQYAAIGRRLLNWEPGLSDMERKKDITTAMRRNSLIKAAEIAAAVGLLLEAGLLTWVLVQ
ncbi:MAG: hypothetical protein ACT4PZ_01720 [Panacagrimonas sp.]